MDPGEDDPVHKETLRYGAIQRAAPRPQGAPAAEHSTLELPAVSKGSLIANHKL